MPWQEYVVSGQDRHNWEPKDPEGWMKLDRLLPFIREFNRERDIRRFEERVGWTFAAWTRLPYEVRRKCLFERAVVATVLQAGTYRRIDHFFAVGYQSELPFGAIFNSRFSTYGEYATINVSTPLAPEIIDVMEIEQLNVPGEPLFQNRVAIRIQYLPPPVPFAKVSQPTQMSSGPGSPQPIASSDVLYGASASGLVYPGLASAFGRDDTSSDPRLVGSAHVLGSVGSPVIAFGQKIGHVIDVDTTLDAAVVELDQPWAVDYRVRTLGVIPAPPVLPTASMNIQFVDQNGVVQTGYIWQSILVGPGLATIGVAPHFTCSCKATGGDSGALIMTGHYGVSAWQHYAAVTAPEVIDMYTCAMLGNILGGVGGAPAAVPNQVIGIPIVEVLASLKLEPLHR
jgi:hypothetical protein